MAGHRFKEDEEQGGAENVYIQRKNEKKKEEKALLNRHWDVRMHNWFEGSHLDEDINTYIHSTMYIHTLYTSICI